MKPIFGNELVNELRKRGDAVQNRLWIAVPYIGTQDAVFRILGKEWLENSSVDFKVLTDVSDLRAINSKTLNLFYDRGEVRTLKGLHAKIYIIDDDALITSANLTGTAFSKRYEIGVFQLAVDNVVSMFSDWWHKAEMIGLDEIKEVKREKNTADGDTPNARLKKIWSLPELPGRMVKKREVYTRYERLILDFENFASKYEKVQRIWPEDPIFMEIDGFFNYLFHVGTRPSKGFMMKPPRDLTEKAQVAEIKRWAHAYRKWNKEQSFDDIDWRRENTRVVQKKLSPGNISKIDFDDLEEILGCLNSMNSYDINKSRVLNPSNNYIKDIRKAFSTLIYGKSPVGARIKECERGIKYFGKSSANELIACFYPNDFPLINSNSVSGLRFFGYPSKM